MEAQTTATSTEVSTPVSESAPQAASPVSEVTPTQTDTQSVQAEWKPDYRFKYRDEQENKVEGEIDEWARGFITKDNEENVKRIWAKANGLDYVKNRFNKMREEYTGYKGQVEPLLQTWNDLSSLYNKGDLDGFFRGLNIPDQKIYQYVLDRLNYNDLPPEQRAMRDQQQQVLRQNLELEKQNQFYQQQYEAQMVQRRENDLGQTLNRPDVSAVAQAFDSRVGRQGAFRDEVVKRGVLHWNMYQKDISPEEAVNEVLTLVGGMANSASDPQAAQQGLPSAAPGGFAQQKATPTIPNVGAKNSSPARRAPKSLDEIRKLADQL